MDSCLTALLKAHDADQESISQLRVYPINVQQWVQYVQYCPPIVRFYIPTT